MLRWSTRCSTSSDSNCCALLLKMTPCEAQATPFSQGGNLCQWNHLELRTQQTQRPMGFVNMSQSTSVLCSISPLALRLSDSPTCPQNLLLISALVTLLGPIFGSRIDFCGNRLCSDCRCHKSGGLRTLKAKTRVNTASSSSLEPGVGRPQSVMVNSVSRLSLRRRGMGGGAVRDAQGQPGAGAGR
jgi:hypothetical protein